MDGLVRYVVRVEGEFGAEVAIPGASELILLAK